MIRALDIENFKGIAGRQRVDFAPLTLLFGPNSAGKSTVLQALIYLHELLERGTADVDRTELGGGVLELGGFARLVHRHELNRPIVLRAEFETPGRLERYGRDLYEFPVPDLEDEAKAAWLELTIRATATATFRGALIDCAEIGVGTDPVPLVRMEMGSSLREHEPLNVRVNVGHSVFADVDAEVIASWRQIAVRQVAPKSVIAEGKGNDEPGGSNPRNVVASSVDWSSQPAFAVSRSRRSALPPLGEPLNVFDAGDTETIREILVRLDEKANEASPDHAELLKLRGSYLEVLTTRERTVGEVTTFLEMVVTGTVIQLAKALKDAIYIGPLRAVPPRGFLYERAGRILSWADGLAAWERLLADRSSLVEQTNAWLRRLGAECQVVVQQLYDSSASAEELSEAHVDRTARRLMLDTGRGSLVLPSEVGAGISQIIPVVVAALESRPALTLVEQPEIHVHPAMQVGLGDLFIQSVTQNGAKRTMLIETHSEHLVLRLLRRIRETTDDELEDGAPSFTADKLSVLYVDGTIDGVRIRRLEVDEQGEFKDRWPQGFFEERARELF